MAVSRYDNVRRVTPIQTYVSERIDLPFDDVREDLKTAQAEQDTNLASATALASEIQDDGYEGASDAHAKSVLTDMDNRVRDILGQGDLRGAGADISNLALDFKRETQTGALRNMAQDKANYDRYKALNDSKLGSSLKEETLSFSSLIQREEAQEKKVFFPPLRKIFFCSEEEKKRKSGAI